MTSYCLNFVFEDYEMSYQLKLEQSRSLNRFKVKV